MELYAEKHYLLHLSIVSLCSYRLKRMDCLVGTFILLVWEYADVADSYLCNIPWDLVLPSFPLHDAGFLVYAFQTGCVLGAI